MLRLMGKKIFLSLKGTVAMSTHFNTGKSTMSLCNLTRLINQPPGLSAERGGSVGRLGIKSFLVCDSPPVESLCCVHEHDTLSAA